MDDVYKNFLGTHIQYCEQQIFRLEKEYELMRDRQAQTLIENGFMDDIEEYNHRNINICDDNKTPINNKQQQISLKKEKLIKEPQTN
mmetsp:Transcript_47112/g.57891  ORF Transcript_47112/g.57891 Transcript_47112/m.57891 type:complete len:87 (-) Transcript_47112:89-349(-)